MKGFLARAIELKAEALNSLAQLKSWHQQLRDSIKSISKVYCPFSLADSTLQVPEQVRARLDGMGDRIRQLVHDARLPRCTLDWIGKTYRVVPEMILARRSKPTLLLLCGTYRSARARPIGSSRRSSSIPGPWSW